MFQYKFRQYKYYETYKRCIRISSRVPSRCHSYIVYVRNPQSDFTQVAQLNFNLSSINVAKEKRKKYIRRPIVDGHLIQSRFDPSVAEQNVIVKSARKSWKKPRSRVHRFRPAICGVTIHLWGESLTRTCTTRAGMIAIYIFHVFFFHARIRPRVTSSCLGVVSLSFGFFWHTK